MEKIRRLRDESAGFIKDVSDIIAAEMWKNPLLVPDLSKDKTLFIFSDYSREGGELLICATIYCVCSSC